VTSCCIVLAQPGEGRSDTGVVLIHGYGSGVFTWRHIMWPLARQCRCRVIAFDRPAFGALPPYTFAEPNSCMIHLAPHLHGSCKLD